MADVNISDGDILRTTATFLIDNTDVCQWVWNYESQGSAVIDTDDLGGALVTTMTTAWAALDQAVTNQLAGSIVEMALYDAVEDKWNTILQESIAALVGTGLGSYMPLGSALLLKLFSTRAKALGKKYLFGLLESDIDDGQWDASNLSAALAWGALNFNPLLVTGVLFVACVFNQTTQDVNHLTGTLQAESNASYQRRRKPGVGL